MKTLVISRLPKPCLLLRRYICNPAASQDMYSANNYIRLVAKRGQLEVAHQLFAKMRERNIVSWTVLISSYAQHGKLDQCFHLFAEMLSHYMPNDFAYASLLSVCDHRRGQQVHGLALKTGFDSWIYVGNALVAMYWKKKKNDSLEAGMEAWRVFHGLDFQNIVTYNSMIAGLGMHGQGEKAMTLFIRMHRDGVGFDRTTLLILVSSINNEGQFLGCLQQLHCLGIKSGLTLDAGVATALIKAYSLLPREFSACQKLFLGTSSRGRDVILWTGIMSVAAEQEPDQAVNLFNEMRREEDISPDCYVFSVLLKACANQVTERTALSVHCQVIKSGFVGVVELANALIHAYARCGSICNAQQVFEEMRDRDIISWNSMLKGYALHGMADAVMKLFRKMDVGPDETTLVALLTSCSHAGLVKEGSAIFDTMEEKYGIAPKLDHYACMVDILGRAGHLSEAEEIIRRMPMEPDNVVWSAFLGACYKHGDTTAARFASSKLDPGNSLGYVLISNMYCSASGFKEGSLVRKKMNRAGVRKEAGLSWTEVGQEVHEFACGGERHPQLKEIRAHMEVVLRELKKMGYVPNVSWVVFDVEQENREEQLYQHSEKLALVFCLMNDCNGNGGVIKIIKNIRICIDCHNFMRIASRLVQKVIIVRDANRFHHFKDGDCSCNDYW